MTISSDDIDRLLPQTQCERCGFEGCMPYAKAIASGEADINRCAPGGEETIAALAALTGKPPKPLDPECGEHTSPTVALIDEDVCIGCTRCIQACPVDAIVGAAKLMHTVIADECTGCGLCLPPCPVDCIDLVPTAPPAQTTEPETEATTDYIETLRQRYLPLPDRLTADHTRNRFEARNSRLETERQEREAERQKRRTQRTAATRKKEIDAMVNAVRTRRNEPRP